jgi:iron complex outermembrane receptor protein
MSPPFCRKSYRLHRWLLTFGLGLLVVMVGTSPSSAQIPAVSAVVALKRLSIEELMEIEVTSVSRSPMALGEAPSALQVLTSVDIRRSGGSSIPEVLRLANNLNVAQKNAHDWGISARGFNTELANKLLVMMDGRTLYTPLFSGVRWGVQDYVLHDIEQIEVISGPGGSVWGANAVNGVINITSKSARATQGFYGELGGGNQLRRFSALRYGGALARNIHFRVYGKYTERNSEVFGSGVEAEDGSDLRQVGFRLDADTEAHGSVTVQGDTYLGWEGLPRAGDAKVAGGNLLGRWTQMLANGSDVRMQVYYDRAFLRQPVAAGLFGPAGTFSDTLDTYDLDFQHNLNGKGSHAVTWGLAYRFTRDESKDAPALGFDPRSVEHDLLSAFVQDQFWVGEHAYVTAGTKLEHNDYTGIEIEPSIRLQSNLTPNHMVWGAISRAVRMPSRVDRDIRQPSRGLTILSGGRDFRSETVMAYEAGYRGQLSNRVAGSVSFFHNDYRHIRSLARTPVTVLPLYFANDLEGETHGVEMNFSYHATHWWRWTGGYTLLKSKLRVRPGGVDLNNALNETSDPETQVAVGSSVDLPRGVELDAHLRWVDTLENNNNGRVGTVPSYVDLTVRLGWNFSDHWEFSLVGQNLLDDHHPEFAVPNANRVEVRRSVFGKAAWSF